MPIFRKILVFTISTVLLIVILLFCYAQYQKPTYEGTLQLTNLKQSTKVYFDNYGIPHIYAQSQMDAMTALGYVHAQDRLWQMELLRRIAPGKLSEILGNKTLKTDMFFAKLGINESSEEALLLIDKKSQPYLLANAYLDGLNQFVNSGKTPIEFSLLGVKKSLFTLKDVYNIFGFMSFSFAMAQKTDPFLTDIRDKLGSDYLKDLGINIESNTIAKKAPKNILNNYNEISKSISLILSDLPASPFVGSNAWVIGSAKTSSGKVIFSNDPHIEYSQPGTWYEAHISTPDFENYGYYVAGTPFPLLGHNRKYAYGMTMFENDDADFFEEKLNPKNENEYLHEKRYKKFSVLKKIIKIKDSANVSITIKSSVHGPIINDVLQDFTHKNPVSLFWIHTKLPNNALEATYGLSHSKGLPDFEQNISNLAAPGLNIMYGDATNNIAWFTTGKLYKLQKNVNPNFILDGSNGIDDKKEFLDFKKNPHEINPYKQYVFSSNNEPLPIDGYDYPGYYLPQDRANRITKLLEKKSNWDVATSQKMLTDATSDDAAKCAKVICAIVNKKEMTSIQKSAFTILNKWQGTNELTDIAPTIYNKFLFFYLKNTFEDEMGAKSFDQFLKTHLIKQTISLQLNNDTSIWWDNILTNKTVENRADIITKSFKQAVNKLEIQMGKNPNNWQWKHVHQLEIKHALGSVAILKNLLNVKKIPIAGSNEVINNTMFTYSDANNYVIKAGPSTRRLIDFSNIENSVSILPTGNSGNPFSTHYNDQAQMYVEGTFRKMLLNKKEIIKTSTLLTLSPKR